MKVLFASVIFSIFTINTAFAFGLAPSAIPPGIQYYLPITLTNYQGTAVTANTQIAIGTYFIGGNALSAANTLVTGFNALAYQQYEACNLQNVEFFFANGTVINSWLEGNIIKSGTSNALCTGSSSPNSLSASANVLWWINYPWPTSFLPANTGTATTNTIYMGFASPSSSVVNGNTVGEAPTISYNYAEYDNGAKVFLSYFNGDTPTGDFTVSSGYTLSKLTGAIMPGGSTGDVIHITGYGSDAPFTYNNGYPIQSSIVEASSQLQPGSLPNAQGIVAVLNSQTISSSSGIGVTMGYASSYFSQEYLSSGTGTTDQNQQGSAVSSWVYGSVNFTGTSSSSWTGHIAPQLYSTSGGYGGILTSQPLTSGSELYLSNLGASTAGYPYNLYINWERARAYPPDGILPATTFGSVTLAGCSASITTPSNSIVDVGQYESFTASENDCASPFTYNILVANSITPSVITHNDLLTGQTANSVVYAFQTTSTDTSNSPEEANVVVTDSGTNTVSSGYSPTFTINPALATPTLTSSPSLPSTQNVGNTITFTSSWSGGTSTYTANYLIVNTITGNLVANMLFTGITGTSNSFTWVIPSNLAGNTLAANVFITDSATSPETTNSVKTGTLTVIAGAPTTPTLSNCPSSAKLDVGQTVSCTASLTGGTSPYTYNWLISNSATDAITANMLFTGVASTTNTFTYTTVSADTSNSPEKFNVIVTDAVSETVNSIYSSTFTINPALTTPTAPTPANPTIDSGQTITLSSSWSGGTSPYTVKWYTGPSGNTCSQDSANVLATYSSVSATSNSITVTPTSTNSYCIGVTDSATTPVTQLSSNDVVFVNTALGTPSLAASNTPTVDTGQYEAFSSSWTGGTLPYTANYLVFNTVTDALIANAMYTGITGTSNTFLWLVPTADAGNTISANVLITDSASNPVTVNSIQLSSITIQQSTTTSTTSTSTSTSTTSSTTLTTTIAPSGSGGGSGSGGIIIHPPSTSVSSISTSSTTSTSTSISSTSTTSSASTTSTSSTTVKSTIPTSTIKPVIIAESAKISPGAVANINFTSYNLTVKVKTNSNVTKNVTIELYKPVNLNTTLQNYTDIFSFYLNASSSEVSMNVTLVYNCKYGNAVAPFVVENGTLNQIYTAVLLQNPCRITFSAPNRHLIGLFAYTPKQTISSTTSRSTSVTTTYVQTELSAYDSYYIAAAVAAVAIIAYLIWAWAKNRTG